MIGAKLTRGDQDYAQGANPPVINWQGRNLGVAICFESLQPAHMANLASTGGEVIVAIANDQWLSGSAKIQHLNGTALRGLEIDREILFVSNGGPTAHLRDGKIVGATQPDGSPIWSHPNANQRQTYWVRWGGWGLFGLWVISGLIAWGVSRYRFPTTNRFF